jgi:hypothetical protein
VEILQQKYKFKISGAVFRLLKFLTGSGAKSRYRIMGEYYDNIVGLKDVKTLYAENMETFRDSPLR